MIFSVRFSENVIGFDIGDVNLNGTAGPSGLLLQGGPKNFVALAQSVAGEGTVTASVGAGVAIDLAGNANESSTSSDNTVVIDSHGGIPGSATVVSMSGTTAGGTGSVNGWLEDGDVDVFSFTLTEPTHVRAETTGAVDTLGRLMNLAGEVLNNPAGDDDRGAGRNFRAGLPLFPGTYFIEVSSKGASPSGAYQLVIDLEAMVNFQPDNRVGGTVGGAIGDDIYDTATGQTLSLISKKARTVRGLITVENDGELPDSFTLEGTPGNALFRVTYTSGGENVTAEVTTGIFQTDSMAPGDPAQVIGVTVQPNRKKIVKRVKRGGRRKVITRKKQQTLRLEAVSDTDGVSSDVGIVRVQTR